MKLSLGFSPCPNDTFIFDALIHQKIDTGNLSFELHMADVEELNTKATEEELQVTKLSYHAYATLQTKYNLLSSGSALGNNCGPLLISNKRTRPNELERLKIAIPGEQTTANFLLNYYAGKKLNTEIFIYSEIEEAILSGKADAGVIIHENRFTFEEKGLQLIQDLGEHWEKTTNYPIPLGGIAIHKSVPEAVQIQVNHLIKESILYAFEHYEEELPQFVQKHAQEMDEEVMRKHIELYVNKYSVNLGKDGKAAIQYMLSRIHTKPLTIIE